MTVRRAVNMKIGPGEMFFGFGHLLQRFPEMHIVKLRCAASYPTFSNTLMEVTIPKEVKGQVLHALVVQ